MPEPVRRNAHPREAEQAVSAVQTRSAHWQDQQCALAGPAASASGARFISQPENDKDRTER